MRELWLIRGLPGSGKSEFAKLIASGIWSTMTAVRISLDAWIDEHGAFDPDLASEWHDGDLKVCEDNMAEGTPLIIVDNVFAHPWEMRDFRSLARLYDYKCRSMVMENRHHGRPRRFIDSDTLGRMQRRFKIRLR